MFQSFSHRMLAAQKDFIFVLPTCSQPLDETNSMMTFDLCSAHHVSTNPTPQHFLSLQLPGSVADALQTLVV